LLWEALPQVSSEQCKLVLRRLRLTAGEEHREGK